MLLKGKEIRKGLTSRDRQQRGQENRLDGRCSSKESVRPYLRMLYSSFAFACMGALVHALRVVCDWQVIFLARVCLQLIFALTLAYLSGVRLRFGKPYALWVRSLAGSAAMVCLFFAYTRLPVSDVLVLFNMFPIWVALLSWPLLDQRPSGLVWLAIASAVAGVVLMQPPEWSADSIAYLVALLCSLFTAVAYLALRRLQEIDTPAVVVHFSGVALVFCFACLFLFERRLGTMPEWYGWTGIELLGVGAAALIGQLFVTSAMKEGHTAKVSVVGLTQIVFAMLFDGLVFGYHFTEMTLLGMALVLVPTACLIIFDPLRLSEK